MAFCRCSAKKHALKCATRECRLVRLHGLSSRSGAAALFHSWGILRFNWSLSRNAMYIRCVKHLPLDEKAQMSVVSFQIRRCDSKVFFGALLPSIVFRQRIQGRCRKK
ncbi:unnamed protein product [Effrenium voratum]|uniref:Uncharacterized protein n=1 Tax=Effrenium voratum TaxID=2562239 RepID=A0AA36I697_9DINO|nr:unnamed protein product [Effrenium voratum]CAJ1436336.1 unnamed protein product [Effrenium voratum]